MSVKITNNDLRKVKIFVNLCDKLGLDYKTHHSLRRKAIKLLDAMEAKEQQEQEPQKKTKSIYETTTDALYNWWNGSQKEKEIPKATQKVASEETCFDEKVAEILIAILEERAEKVAPHRETHIETNADFYDGCEC